MLSLETDIRKDDRIVIFTQKGEAVAFAQALMSSEEIMKMGHGFVAQTIRVLMDRETYPKMWSKASNT